MADFEIEEYTVRLTHNRGGLPYQTIFLTGVALAHGIRNHASIIFTDEQQFLQSFGFVFNVDQPNFDGLTVVSYLPMNEYAGFYDVLRSERPVRLFYGYTPAGFDSTQPRRDLNGVSIGTGPEPLGEGPIDVTPP